MIYEEHNDRRRDMNELLTVIAEERQKRGWTEYQLAEKSGLPQSTISSWYRKNMVPTVPSLEKICAAFGITLPQLFAAGQEPVPLTEPQRRLLTAFAKCSEQQQAALLAFLESL